MFNHFDLEIFSVHISDTSNDDDSVVIVTSTGLGRVLNTRSWVVV